MIAAFQSRLLFPTHLVGPAGALPKGTRQLTIDTGGDQLHGLHIRPAGRRSANRPTLILGFGGNAWNAADAATYLHGLYPREHVVVFHYRGYRPSTGSPSATALLDDALLVYDEAVAEVQPERTIAVGFSIGSGVAASLADRRPVDGIIMVTPFDSLKAVAGDLYPWVPVGLLFAHEIDAASYLARSKVPVAIIGAANDMLILPRRTDALRRRVGNLAFDRTIAGAGHNDIYERWEFHEAMKDALVVISKS